MPSILPREEGLAYSYPLLVEFYRFLPARTFFRAFGDEYLQLCNMYIYTCLLYTSDAADE